MAFNKNTVSYYNYICNVNDIYLNLYFTIFNFPGRLLSGITQMKQILSNRVSNPENNVDWSSHLNNIVSTATGINKN